MQIAELFVSLGIKGAEKTVGAMGGVKKGLSDIGSTSLEVKAGILAAMYGLERMMSISGAAGTGFQNFAALTGLSIQKLQEWQYAARQAGVSSEEMAGSLKAVQNTMSNVLLGKGAPELFARVAQAAGGIDQSKFKDTFYMMDKLQTAMKNLSIQEGNIAGKSMGLSEGVISAMRRNVFTPQMFSNAPKYSDGEAGSLDKSNIAWSNLENKIQMAFGHFNAKHGQSLVGDISKSVDQIFKLAEAFLKLSEKIRLFDIINEIFKGWGFIFETIGLTIDKLISITESDKNTKDGALDKNGNLKKNPIAMARDWVGGFVDKQQSLGGFHDRLENLRAQSLALSKVAPGVSDGGRQKIVTNNTNVTQNLTHIGDAKDTRPVSEMHGKAAKHAHSQRSATRQGS